MLVLTPLTAFDQFFKLPDSLLHAAAKVMKLSNRYVILNEAQQIDGLNWDGFKDAVVAHPPPGLAFVKLESTSITNHTGSVDDMAGKVAQFLYDTFSLQGIDNDGLRAQIRAAFEYVRVEESGGFFSTSTYGAHGTSWEYRIVFALAHPDDADCFYSVVTTIKCVLKRGVAHFPLHRKGGRGRRGRSLMFGSLTNLRRTFMCTRVSSGSVARADTTTPPTSRGWSCL